MRPPSVFFFILKAFQLCKTLGLHILIFCKFFLFRFYEFCGSFAYKFFIIQFAFRPCNLPVDAFDFRGQSRFFLFQIYKLAKRDVNLRNFRNRGNRLPVHACRAFHKA